MRHCGLGPQVGGHRRAQVRVAASLVGAPWGCRTGAERTARPAWGAGEPTRMAGDPGPREPPGRGRGRRGGDSAASVLRPAQDRRQGALRTPARPPAPPVGGAALSPQPPPQPPPGPPRVPGGVSAAAAGSSMRTEPGPGHGDPQHHGPGQPFCLFPLPPFRARRRRHASPGMCGLGWARARSSRSSRPAPRRAPLNKLASLGAWRPAETPREYPAAKTPEWSPFSDPPQTWSTPASLPPPPPSAGSAQARSLNAGSLCSRPWSRPSLAEMWRKCVLSSRRRRISMCW